jgi:hypothetical protein
VHIGPGNLKKSDRQGVTAETLSRGCMPGIPVVQSAEAWHRHNFGSRHTSWVYHPSLGRILVHGVVDTVLVIVADVIANQPAQVTFIQDDHMIQQFPAAASHPALRDSILPGTPKAGSDQLAAQVFERLLLPLQRICCHDRGLGRDVQHLPGRPREFAARSRRSWDVRWH